jgi:hypothetical protein
MRVNTREGYGAKESGGVASRLKPPIHYFLGAAGFRIPNC